MSIFASQLSVKLRRLLDMSPSQIAEKVSSRVIPKSARYWSSRETFLYYQKTLEVMAEANAESVIDVGGWQGEFLHAVDFISDKTCLDIRQPKQKFPDVKLISANFLEYQPKQTYDLALCLQVLEHLDDDSVGDFAKKLFTLAPRVIISVPYQWNENACEYHLQDPVDLQKLKSWTQREPDSTYIIKEVPDAEIGSAHIRVICEYRT